MFVLHPRKLWFYFKTIFCTGSRWVAPWTGRRMLEIFNTRLQVDLVIITWVWSSGCCSHIISAKSSVLNAPSPPPWQHLPIPLFHYNVKNSCDKHLMIWNQFTFWDAYTYVMACVQWHCKHAMARFGLIVSFPYIYQLYRIYVAGSLKCQLWLLWYWMKDVRTPVFEFVLAS